MSPRLNVDTDELHSLAGRIRLAAAEAANAHANPGAMRTTMTRLGDPGLVAASQAFLEHWSYALGEVVDDAVRLADQIALVAQTCADVEAANARSFLP